MTFTTARLTPLVEIQLFVKLIRKKTAVMKSYFLRLKCVETHLQASKISKIFPGLYPRTPVETGS
jgi:hypothetical protein